MTTPTPNLRTDRPRARGMALLMVLFVIGVCTVLALTMMSSSLVTAIAGDAIVRGTRADYLAESGIEYAIHQIQKTGAADGQFTGTTLSLGGELGGTCTVTVTPVIKSLASKARPYLDRYPLQTIDDVMGAQEYLIVSTVATTENGLTSRGRASARVLVWPESLRINYAAVTGGQLQLDLPSPARVMLESAAVAVRFHMRSPSTVPPPGLVYCNLFDPLCSLSGLQRRPYSGASVRITSSANVRTFQTYQAVDGSTGTAAAVPLSGGALSGFTSLTGTAANPANVYRHSGNLTLGSNVTIRGTLVVDGGTLTINGSNNTIDASQSHSSGFPAIVVRGGSIVFGSGAVSGTVLTVNGVTWLSGNVGSRTAGANTQMNFYGAVVTETGQINSMGTINIYHRPNWTNVPLLDQALPCKVMVIERATGGDVRDWSTF